MKTHQLLFFLSVGLQKTFGREQPTYFKPQQSPTSIPPSSRDPQLSHALQNRSLRGHPQLGQGGEDRRRLRCIVLQGHGPRNLLRLYQQLHGRHGVRKARVKEKISSSRFPQSQTGK